MYKATCKFQIVDCIIGITDIAIMLFVVDVQFCYLLLML